MSLHRIFEQRKGVGLAIAVSVVALTGGAALAMSSGSSEHDQPIRVVELEPASHEVTADELWNASLDAVYCFRDHGINAAGPYPGADGSRVNYSVEVTEATPEVEAGCTAALEPLAFRFALDNAPEREALGASGADGSGLVIAEPATEQARRLVEIRIQIVECLQVPVDLEPSEVEVELAEAALGDPARFETCAAKAS